MPPSSETFADAFTIIATFKSVAANTTLSLPLARTRTLARIGIVFFLSAMPWVRYSPRRSSFFPIRKSIRYPLAGVFIHQHGLRIYRFLIYFGRSIRACGFVDKLPSPTVSRCKGVGRKSVGLGDELGIRARGESSRFLPHGLGQVTTTRNPMRAAAGRAPPSAS